MRIALRPRVLAEARYPWAYLLKIIRNEALNIVRRRKPMRRLKERHPVLVRIHSRSRASRFAPFRPAGAGQAAATAGRGRRSENLGRNDIRGNRRGAGTVSEYGGQPLSLRLAEAIAAPSHSWRRCTMTDLRQLREIEKLVRGFGVLSVSPAAPPRSRSAKRGKSQRSAEAVAAIRRRILGRHGNAR